jgi:5-formyltetrahydrofolate cyclo-ligase
VKKSEIRKRILKKRKLKSYKNLQINFKYLIGILKKKKIVGKIVGGYYPYNY